VTAWYSRGLFWVRSYGPLQFVPAMEAPAHMPEPLSQKKKHARTYGGGFPWRCSPYLKNKIKYLNFNKLVGFHSDIIVFYNKLNVI
jgi:hypothetical protein